MAGNSTRWNNSKKSKRIENNKSRYEKYYTMKKSNFTKWGFLVIMIIFFTGLLILFFTSCQPTNPLAGLNCPCKVISAELTYNGHKVKYIDKDGKEQTVISKALYDQYHKNKPLNK